MPGDIPKASSCFCTAATKERLTQLAGWTETEKECKCNLKQRKERITTQGSRDSFWMRAHGSVKWLWYVYRIDRIPYSPLWNNTAKYKKRCILVKFV